MAEGRGRRRTVGTVLGAVAVVVLGLLGWGQLDTQSPPSPNSDGVVAAAQLPQSAHQTLQLIDAGGPFPYRQDGGVFGNREGLLPERPSGYYREYTVDQPGSPDRGPWRIVTGGEGPEVYYWTADHYDSFSRIDR